MSLPGGGVPGRADHQSLFVFGANRGETCGRFVETEVNHQVGFFDDRQQVVPQINLTGHLKRRVAFGAGHQSLSHAALGAGDDEFYWIQA